MTEIVNLAKARKRLLREQQAAQAAQNRVRSGRTGAQKRNERSAAETRTVLFEGKRLAEPASGQPEPPLITSSAGD